MGRAMLGVSFRNNLKTHVIPQRNKVIDVVGRKWDWASYICRRCDNHWSSLAWIRFQANVVAGRPEAPWPKKVASFYCVRLTED